MHRSKKKNRNSTNIFKSNSSYLKKRFVKRGLYHYEISFYKEKKTKMNSDVCKTATVNHGSRKKVCAHTVSHCSCKSIIVVFERELIKNIVSSSGVFLINRMEDITLSILQFGVFSVLLCVSTSIIIY